MQRQELRAFLLCGAVLTSLTVMSFSFSLFSLASRNALSLLSNRSSRWRYGRVLPSGQASSLPDARQFRVAPYCEMPRNGFEIPHDRLDFSYSRSSGPGGQNVNKLNTRVELRFHVEDADWIPEDMRHRFLEQQRHRVNKLGEFVLSSQEHRTQLKNREECVRKLEEALTRAAVVPKRRNMRTGLTEWEKENRLREKKKRSEKKASRRRNGKWDE
ncbi:peptidyl-trna hydrolase mitochondrial-like protein [Nannochloropsis gaditana]|uniref:Peptidyl-trna hydrolase mitochondrial-like protein n=1 Tax=Nannochloropsis gaditana TaxID=72520 RepID=W7T6I3_9STRA|nr:peptidyl-trna hydrolase mitochondrial-like protein [Nannochloropsis gaditana]